MPVSFKGLSSACLLGIPRESLLSKGQNLPRSPRVQSYLCQGVSASFRCLLSQEAATCVWGEGGAAEDWQ